MHQDAHSLIPGARCRRRVSYEAYVLCHCHGSFHVQRIAHDQHLAYSVTVCEVLRIQNVLIRRMGFVFNQNVTRWDASL